METQKSKTVFIEYSSSEPGQHFMTVVQTQDHKRIIIGRIYREYDKETKKSKYHAKDFAGNQVFADITDLYALKKGFIENGKNLADMAKMSQQKKMKQPEKPVNSLQKAERASAVKNIREKKFTKDKTKNITQNKPNEKAQNTRIEKEQDAKNTEKYKDVEQGKEQNNSKGNVPEQEIAESNSDKPILDEQKDNTQNVEQSTEQSDRMEELEDIRDNNNEVEQDIDLDR